METSDIANMAYTYSNYLFLRAATVIIYLLVSSIKNYTFETAYSL